MNPPTRPNIVPNGQAATKRGANEEYRCGGTYSSSIRGADTVIKPQEMPRIMRPIIRAHMFKIRLIPVPIIPTKQANSKSLLRPRCMIFPAVIAPIMKPKMTEDPTILSQRPFQSPQAYLTDKVLKALLVQPGAQPATIPARIGTIMKTNKWFLLQ